MLVKRLVSYSLVALALTVAIRLLGNSSSVAYWKAEEWMLERPPVGAPWILSSDDKRADAIADANAYRYGLARQGYSDGEMTTNLVAKLVQDTLNQGVHSASKASPVSYGDSIIVATDMGLLKLIDTRTGATHWTLRSLAAANGFHSTPVVVGDRILSADYWGNVYWLEGDSGKVIWALQIGNAVGGTPLVHRGAAYFSVETGHPNGYFAKVDLASGRIVWLSDWLGDQTHSSLALDSESNVLVAGDNTGHFNGIDAESGKLLWRVATGKPIKGTPAISRGIAYVGSWDGNIRAVDVRAGTVVWKKYLSDGIQSSVAILPKRDLGFVNSREGLCRFDLATGTQVLCSNERYGRESQTASPVISRMRGSDESFLVWTPCLSSSFCVYDPDTLRTIRKWDFPSPISGEARIHDGKIYVVTNQSPGLWELSRSETLRSQPTDM